MYLNKKYSPLPMKTFCGKAVLLQVVAESHFDKSALMTQF